MKLDSTHLTTEAATPSSVAMPTAVRPKLGRRHLLQTLVTGAAALSAASTASAKLETYQKPTAMTLGFSTASARRGTRVTATASLTRLDNGGPVPSAEISFYFGSHSFPTQVIARRYTNTQGVAQISFTISDNTGLGRRVLVAQFLGNNTYAQPLPCDFINVTA